MDFLDKLQSWVDSVEATISEWLSGLDRSLRVMERELLRRILRDVLPKLDVKDGKILATTRNLARLNLIDAVMRDFAGDKLTADLMREFSGQLLEISGMNAESYLIAGFDAKKVEAVSSDLGLIRTVIGLDDKGGILEGGYLSKLAKADDVRGKIRDYVVQAMTSQTPPDKMAEGLTALVQGTKSSEGALRSHWRAYAYDTYSQIREVSNLHTANELKANAFVYMGGIIKTSRPFCVKRNRKVFTRDEANEWRNDPDLIDKATRSTYNPLIERGRWRCRHFLMWVSDERAKELRPDIKL